MLLNVKVNVACAVCGHSNLGRSAYLVAARLAPNRITILRWNPDLAQKAEGRGACSPEHVLEIVAHWLVSGRIDLMFTEPTGESVQQALHQEPGSRRAIKAFPESGETRPIGEIVMNRDSMRGILASDPQALASVLDSLLEALLREQGSAPVKIAASERAPLHTSVA